MTRYPCVRRRRLPVLALSAALTVVVAATLIAQSPTFKSKVTHVLLDVVVTDKDDRPVTDLTADDFEIVEHGNPQTIADFEKISIPLGGRAIESLKAIPGPPPDTFTNAPPSHSGRAIVIWIHQIPLSEFVRAKRVLAELVRSLNPDDRVAVTYGSRSDIAQDFGRDPGLLMKAFDRLADAVTSLHEEPFETMRTAVNVLQDAPELRKLVIAVTDSLPWDADKYTSLGPVFFQQLGRARRAGIPVYVISSTGLEAPGLMLQGHMEDQTPEAMAAGRKAARESVQNMRTVAEYTGGRALVSLPDPVQGLRDLLVDAGSYYLLGFYPQPYDSDGKFHEVEVRTKRKGLHVRARLGYTAANGKKPERVLPLADTLGAGLPGGDLVLRALAAPVAPGNRGVTTWVTTDVTYPESVGGARRADDVVEVSWIAIDPDAKVRAKGQRSVRVPLGNAPASQFTLMLNDVIDLPAEALTVRMAVSSRTLGTRGTVHVPVVANKLDGKKIESTPLVFGAQAAEPTRMVMLTTEKDVLPFQPSTRRRFAPGAELRLWSRVFAREAVTAEMTVKLADAVVRTLVVKTGAAANVKNATDCDATLSLAGLAAGDYVMEFTARAGTAQTKRSVPFGVR